MDYSAPAIDHSPDDEHRLWSSTKKGKKIRGVDTLPRMKSGGKVKNWIKGAIKHPGRCTPMSKPGCTGAARALALRFKRGGDLHK